MQKFVFIICFFGGLNLSAQKVCEPASVSIFYINNLSKDTLFITAFEKLDISEKKEKVQFIIAPNNNLNIKQLEWADSFKEPTFWFLFKADNNPKLSKTLNEISNWQFFKKDTLNASFTFVYQ